MCLLPNTYCQQAVTPTFSHFSKKKIQISSFCAKICTQPWINKKINYSFITLLTNHKTYCDFINSFLFSCSNICFAVQNSEKYFWFLPRNLEDSRGQGVIREEKLKNRRNLAKWGELTPIVSKYLREYRSIVLIFVRLVLCPHLL